MRPAHRHSAPPASVRNERTHHFARLKQQHVSVWPAGDTAREHDVRTRCGINYTWTTRNTTANANMAITLHLHDSPTNMKPNMVITLHLPDSPTNMNSNTHAIALGWCRGRVHLRSGYRTHRAAPQSYIACPEFRSSQTECLEVAASSVDVALHYTTAPAGPNAECKVS